MSVPSSETGTLANECVCPPGTKGRGNALACGWGGGEVPIQKSGEKALCSFLIHMLWFLLVATLSQWRTPLPHTHFMFFKAWIFTCCMYAKQTCRYFALYEIHSSSLRNNINVRVHIWPSVQFPPKTLIVKFTLSHLAGFPRSLNLLGSGGRPRSRSQDSWDYAGSPSSQSPPYSLPESRSRNKLRIDSSQDGGDSLGSSRGRRHSWGSPSIWSLFWRSLFSRNPDDSKSPPLGSLLLRSSSS